MSDKEKSYEDQIKDCIRQACESCKVDVNIDEFDIDVDLCARSSHSGNLIISNELTLNYRTKLKEKKGKFSFSIVSNIDPEIVAKYAIVGYIKQRDNYIEKQKKEEQEQIEKEEKKSSIFKMFKSLF